MKQYAAPRENLVGTFTYLSVLMIGLLVSASACGASSLVSRLDGGIPIGPKAIPASVLCPTDGETLAILECVDPDTSPSDITYQILSQPDHGDLVPCGERYQKPMETSACYMYQRDPGYEGPDSFQWNCSDDSATSSAATFSVESNVGPPIADDQNVFAGEASYRVVIKLRARLAPSDRKPSRFIIESYPQHGTLEAREGSRPRYTWRTLQAGDEVGENVYYSANPGSFNGDNFTWRFLDNLGNDSNVATVTIEPFPTVSAASALPTQVDLEQTKYFPHIRSQDTTNGTLCFHWAPIYYAFTHNYARAHDIDVKNGDLNATFAPQVAGDFYVGDMWQSWQMLKDIGALTWSEYENGVFSGQNLRKALNRRLKDYYVLDTDDRQSLKRLLAAGNAFVVVSSMGEWEMGSPKDNPSSFEDDPYLSPEYSAITNVYARDYHVITVAGYNDSIWIDSNDDDEIQDHEVGAYLLANSFDDYKRIWIPYALFESNPYASRYRAGYPEPHINYRPEVFARVSLSAENRSYVSISKEIAAAGQPTPEYISDTYGISYQHLSLHGTYWNYFQPRWRYVAIDGALFSDFTPMLNRYRLQLPENRRYSIKVQDLKGAGPVDLSEVIFYKTDEQGNDVVLGEAVDLPRTGQDSDDYIDASIDVAAAISTPDISNVITVTPNVMSGLTDFTVVVRVIELNGLETTAPITVRITKDVLWNLNGGFDPQDTVIGKTPVNNADWQYSDVGDAHQFTMTGSIPASGQSSFGINAIWDSGQTRGNSSITATLVSGSGGEVRVNNNFDAESVDYFIH